MGVKFQAFPERIEFHGASPLIRPFQGFDWIQLKFSRRLRHTSIHQRLTYADNSRGGEDFPGGIWTICQFSKAALSNQNFTSTSLYGYFIE